MAEPEKSSESRKLLSNSVEWDKSLLSPEKVARMRENLVRYKPGPVENGAGLEGIKHKGRE